MPATSRRKMTKEELLEKLDAAEGRVADLQQALDGQQRQLSRAHKRINEASDEAQVTQALANDLSDLVTEATQHADQVFHWGQNDHNQRVHDRTVVSIRTRLQGSHERAQRQQQRIRKTIEDGMSPTASDTSNKEAAPRVITILDE